MQCPSCGAASDGVTCGCASQPTDRMANLETEAPTIEFCESSEAQEAETTSEISTQNSRLIEFPGVTRTAVPGWRKEISERVREVQERKAREAAAEAEAAGIDANPKSAPQLELLPQAETPEINPIVAAALKRIERAHADSAPAYAQARPIAAVAYALNQNFDGADMTVATHEIVDATYCEPEAVIDESIEVTRTHNLVVVPPPTVVVSEEQEVRPKARRVIGDDLNSPALNYLDSIETKIHIEDPSNRASAFRRIIGGLVDLLVLALLCSPFVGGLVWMEANWRDPKVIGLAVVTAVVVNFLYSTIMTALTGRTLGMRLLQLRVIDARTGLIPTGKQSAGRALLYLASFASAGIALMYALVDSEKRTAHDRFTQTAVIRA